MENYENLGTIGEGTYGVVIKARHKETGQIVAIKKFKESEDDEQVRKTSLREVRVLKQLRHDNIINLLEVFRRKGKLYLVFEYVEKTILELLEKHPYGLDDVDVRRYTYQLLRGVEYCHAHGIVHRDIKPENILISKHGALKLCDFGFARLLSGPGAQYTDYVATRWYRSPELLVGDTEYGKGVDVWAIGCILAEITNGIPLFPGESDIDQLFHIIKCFGRITNRQALVFKKNPLYHGIELPNPVELDTLERRFGGQTTDIKWLSLLKSCLANEPRHRCTCTDLLSSAYFAHCGFAEKYEEELKVVMEKDAAANLMRLRRQKQRRPRSNTKSGTETSNDTPSTPQHAWAVSPPSGIPQHTSQDHPKPPKRPEAQVDSLFPKEQSGGLPNLKIQTPRPLPVSGFPYTGEAQPYQHSQHEYDGHHGVHHTQHGHLVTRTDSKSKLGSIMGSSLPCLGGPAEPPVKLKKKTKKQDKHTHTLSKQEKSTPSQETSGIDGLFSNGAKGYALGHGTLSTHSGGHPSLQTISHSNHNHGHGTHGHVSLGGLHHPQSQGYGVKENKDRDPTTTNGTVGGTNNTTGYLLDGTLGLDDLPVPHASGIILPPPSTDRKHPAKSSMWYKGEN